VVTAPAGIRLVAIDIDDTLIPFRGLLSTRVVEAVRNVHSLGVEVVLATGRGITATMPVLEELGLDEAWVLCSNGSVTARVAQGTFDITHRVTFDPRPLVAQLRELDPAAPIAIETSGIGFLIDGDAYPDQAQNPVGQIGELGDAVTFLSVASTVVDLARFTELTAAHPVHATPYVHPGWITVDLVHADAGKGTALAALAASLGIEREHCAAIGDYLNDIPMLEWAGWSVAMGQAPAEVLEVVDVVVAASAEHGVAEALDAIAAARLP
jgi:hydroxymethylpyrimidine pyrophosphatase-like HAD family hydrolase